MFERTKDFHGYQFEAVTLPEPAIVTVYTNKEEIRIDGLFGEVWHGILEKHLNFSTRIRLNPNEIYGVRDEKGTWSGMIQEIHSKRAQLALADLTITKARSEVVEFSLALFKANIGMF